MVPILPRYLFYGKEVGEVGRPLAQPRPSNLIPTSNHTNLKVGMSDWAKAAGEEVGTQKRLSQQLVRTVDMGRRVQCV